LGSQTSKDVDFASAKAFDFVKGVLFFILGNLAIARGDFV
jgi:hypothetical protein